MITKGNKTITQNKLASTIILLKIMWLITISKKSIMAINRHKIAYFTISMDKNKIDIDYNE